jgi:hypothetical protein
MKIHFDNYVSRGLVPFQLFSAKGHAPLSQPLLQVPLPPAGLEVSFSTEGIFPIEARFVVRQHQRTARRG